MPNRFTSAAASLHSIYSNASSIFSTSILYAIRNSNRLCTKYSFKMHRILGALVTCNGMLKTLWAQFFPRGIICEISFSTGYQQKQTVMSIFSLLSEVPRQWSGQFVWKTTTMTKQYCCNAFIFISRVDCVRQVHACVLVVQNVN